MRAECPNRLTLSPNAGLRSLNAVADRHLGDSGGRPSRHTVRGPRRGEDPVHRYRCHLRKDS